MNLAAICSVRDEADIIEQHARHHAALVDCLVYVDDSRDATPEILRRLQAEGLPIEAHASGESTFSYRQAVVMNREIGRVMAETCPDFVLPLDADEFVQATRPELEAALLTIPRGHAGAYIWQTYVPTPDGLRRRTPEGAAVAKAVLSRALALTCKTSVGAHIVEGPDGWVPGTILPFGLGHAPVRSVAQMMGRSIVAGSKVWGPGQDEQQGGYFRDPWLHAWNFAPTLDDARRMAMLRVTYADHPPPTGISDEDRITRAEIRWPELAHYDLTGVLERHIVDLGGVAPAGASVAELESEIERLSRARWEAARG